MLLSTGQRLSPAVLSKAGETLQSMMAGAGTHVLCITGCCYLNHIRLLLYDTPFL